MTEVAPSRTRIIGVPLAFDVSRGSLTRVATILQRSGFPLGRVVLLSGCGPTVTSAETVAASLRAAGSLTVHHTVSAASFEVVDVLAGKTGSPVPDLVVGVGGGRVLDVAKSIARIHRVDVVSVPTAISHDGISSPVASLLDTDGMRMSVPSTTPAAVIIDIDTVESAPLSTMRAGVGDLLGNLSAIADWQLADARGHDKFDAYSALIADSAARPLLSVAGLGRRDTAETLARGLVLSGLAMVAAATSRPCSGAEHLISHALDQLLGRDAREHGAQVALGMLVSTAARGSAPPGMHAAYERFGLPRNPRDLGLSMQLITRAVLAARQTRPTRYTILDEIDMDERSVGALLRDAFVK